MYIYLIRHGETDWNKQVLFQGHTDIPLNKKGEAQARRIGQVLKGKKVDAIVSSDLSRAYRTAELIRKETGYRGRIIEYKALRERSYGTLEGKKYDALLRNKKFDGEKDPAYYARVKKAFKMLAKKYRNKNIVVATHGGVVRAFAAFALNLREYRHIRIYNASISEIYYSEKKDYYFLTLLNSVAHLSAADRNKSQQHLAGV